MKHIIPARLSQSDIDKSLHEVHIIPGSHDRKPQIILHFKNSESAKLYNNSLRLWVMINGSIDSDERAKHPIFHFEVSCCTKGTLSFAIQGNLYNAIEKMRDNELMSPFLAEYILHDEELVLFFKQNKCYELKEESDVDQAEGKFLVVRRLEI